MDNIDILRLIFGYINNKEAFGALAGVNTLTAGVAREHPDIREELTNPLWKLLTKYPDANYDFQRLSHSKHITGKLMARFPYPWDYAYIMSNSRISIQDVRGYPNLPWFWSRMHYVSGFDMAFVLDFVDRPFSWNALTTSPQITFGEICSHSLPWDFSAIVYRHDITTDDIIKYYPRDFPSWHFAYRDNIDVSLLIPLDAEFSTCLASGTKRVENIYGRKDIFELVKKFPELPWDARRLSKSRYITLDLIEELPINWDFSKITI